MLSLGGLASSMVANLVRSRRSRRLAETASVEVDDEERLQVLDQLAGRFNVPVPGLRAIALDQPVAFGLLGKPPSIVVSTWTFDHLSEAEWKALVAHELAHMRRPDRLYRWIGSWLWRAHRGVPGFLQAWNQLDSTMEEAADRAAIAILGDDGALRSARQKFHAFTGTPLPPSLNLLTPPTWVRQLAVVGLGLVATLPLLPLVVVPLCLWVCSL
jgi:beta-lactamase regulating signal transducer with metallopeptidase domain